MLQCRRFRSETELERRSLDQFRYCKFNRSTPLPRTQQPADVQACPDMLDTAASGTAFCSKCCSGAGGRTRYFRSGRHLPKMVAVLDPVRDEGRAHATEC